jgi:hypothetical protein
MAFSIPKNVPDFADPSRDLENRVWAAATRRHAPSGGIMKDVSDRMRGLYDESELPMYKDKPYGGRRRPWWRRKRSLGTILGVGVFLLYMMGFFSGSGSNTTARSGWSLLSSSMGRADTDWLKRRQHVVEAFQLSWDAYERYAWGKLHMARAKQHEHALFWS